jgi:hypothetical protein
MGPGQAGGGALHRVLERTHAGELREHDGRASTCDSRGRGRHDGIHRRRKPVRHGAGDMPVRVARAGGALRLRSIASLRVRGRPARAVQCPRVLRRRRGLDRLRASRRRRFRVSDGPAAGVPVDLGRGRGRERRVLPLVAFILHLSGRDVRMRSRWLHPGRRRLCLRLDVQRASSLGVSFHAPALRDGVHRVIDLRVHDVPMWLLRERVQLRRVAPRRVSRRGRGR